MMAVIDKYSAMPFNYGEDCCTFAAECIEANTGNNPIASLSYANESEAYSIIKGFGSLKAAVTYYLGEPHAGGHKDGDIALIPAGDGRDMVGVICRGQIIGRVEDGLMNWPLARAKAIWCI